MPIPLGKDLDLLQSSSCLPDVSDGIRQLFQPVTVGFIKTSQVNGRTQTIVEKFLHTQGVRVELPNKLVMSKTGERIWDCTDIYFQGDITLEADDLFMWNKIQYRVVETEPWPEYGFNRYHCVQDYTKLYNPNPTVSNYD